MLTCAGTEVPSVVAPAGARLPPTGINPRDERPVEEYLHERATIERARSERQIVEAVTAARRKGLSWQRIGELLGTSAQAAQQRYGPMAESA